MNTGIYEILNTETGIWYRGKAEKYTFKQRWYGHKSALNRGDHWIPQIQEDWDHYGQDAFVFSVLERCPPEQCDEREVWWIGEDYNDSDVSYNKQGGGTRGFSQSDETKQKKSEAVKVAWTRPEYRQKMSEAQTSLEYKQNMSEAVKKALADPEVKRKQSEAVKRFWADPEARRKQSEVMNRPDVKSKNSEAAKRRWADPEYKQKQRVDRSHPFTVTHPDGTVTPYLNPYEAAPELGVSHKTITNYLKGVTTPGGKKKTAHLIGCVFTYI